MLILGYFGKGLFRNKSSEYWPSSVVANDLLHEISPDSSCWLALEGERVVGFCWGYPISSNNLEKKLLLPGLAAKILKHYGEDATVAYQDDMGVLKPYRGQGIARKLFLLRLHGFLQKNLAIGLVRTKADPPTVTYKWFLSMGYEVLDRYASPDNRVILSCRYDDLCASNPSLLSGVTDLISEVLSG